MITEHSPILVLMTFFVAALLMPLAGLVHRRAPWWVAVVASAAATIFAACALVHVASNGAVRYAMGGWQPPIGIELVADPLSTFVAMVLGLIALVVLVHSRDSVEREIPGDSLTYYASAMLLLGGLAGIVMTGDLFNLYVFLEISSLSSYALLGCGTARAALSAFRYLMLGTIGASFYLIGVGFIFVETGSLNMQDVAGIFAVTGLTPLTTLAVLFIVAGMGIKMALLPLHQWLPDAYTHAPATSTALIAPIGTKVAAYVLIRLLFEVFPMEAVLDLHLLDVLAALGAGGIIWGSVMAIPQKNIKRMLAYSSVAQIGYIVLGIGLGTAYGFIGAILHILNHACMKGCLFLVTANLEARGKGVRIDGLTAELRRKMPVTAACFTLAAISMIGLPPTAGFFSKWYLLLGSFEQGLWVYIVVIIVSSLLNAVYFFRIIERMYLGGSEEATEPQEARVPGTFLLTFPTATLALSLLILGLGNWWVVQNFIIPMLPFVP